MWTDRSQVDDEFNFVFRILIADKYRNLTKNVSVLITDGENIK